MPAWVRLCPSNGFESSTNGVGYVRTRILCLTLPKQSAETDSDRCGTHGSDSFIDRNTVFGHLAGRRNLQSPHAGLGTPLLYPQGEYQPGSGCALPIECAAGSIYSTGGPTRD